MTNALRASSFQQHDPDRKVGCILGEHTLANNPMLGENSAPAIFRNNPNSKADFSFQLTSPPLAFR